MLVLYSDGAAVWDVKELELINELRCPRDVQEVVAGDWAASDRVVLLCRDGGIRVMGLSLAAPASSVLEYTREQPLRDGQYCRGEYDHRQTCFLALYRFNYIQ